MKNNYNKILSAFFSVLLLVTFSAQIIAVEPLKDPLKSQAAMLKVGEAIAKATTKPVTQPATAPAKPATTQATATTATAQTVDRGNKTPQELAQERAQKLGNDGTKIVSAARGMMGTRYRYGGTSKDGIDCSGLVVVSMKSATNTNVPHNAAQLYKQGKAVAKADLQPGDLVFFSGTRGNMGGITHVGIYSGNGKFIHASSSKGVREDSLSSDYYSKKYTGARRLH